MPIDEEESIDAFVEQVDLEKRCTAREVVELMRSRLEDVNERVEDGVAVFSKDGNDIAGVSITESHVSLYVPDAGVKSDFCERLGKVEQAPDGFRFDQLTDINRAELRRMIDSLGQQSPPES